jgi:ribose transport system permease protein
LALLLVASCLWEYTQNGNIVFIKAVNIKNLLTWIGLFGILSVAQAIVIITGGIDLSVGSVVALVGIAAAMLLDAQGVNLGPLGMVLGAEDGVVVLHPIVVLPIVLLMSALIGLWHGFLVAKVHLQPFVVTLCGLFFFRGIARLMTDDRSQGFGSAYPGMRWFGRGTLADVIGDQPAPGSSLSLAGIIPAPLLVLIFFAILMAAYLHFSPQGRHIFALGANEEAARFSGIRTSRLKILAYVLCSLLSGLGGLLLAFKTNSLGPTNFGSFYELYAIAGAVLGGCSLRGGSGNILGVIVGASLIMVLRNLVNILGIPSQLEYIVIGAAILIGVAVDEYFSRRAQTRLGDRGSA